MVERIEVRAPAVRAAEGTSEQAVSLTNLAQTLLALGELTAAKEAATRAGELLPDSARIWQLRGQILVRMGDAAGGEAAIRTALYLAQGDPDIAPSCQSDLSTLLLAGGRKKEAMELLERAVAAARPGRSRARMLDNLGVLQWKSGKKAVGVATIRQALAEMEAAVGREHPDVARILEDYAEMLAKTGRKAESRAANERAREMKSALGWQANTGSGAVDWRDLR